MPLTPNLSTVTVTGEYVDVQGNPIAGQVKFTPQEIVIDADENQIIIPRTVTVDLDANGSFSVVLPATDDTDLAPVNWVYRVEEAFSGGRTYFIVIPSSPSSLDLADVVPAVAAGSAEAATYVLLSSYVALETRVTAAEATTTVVSGLAAQISTAASNASGAQAAAEAAVAQAIHPFMLMPI